MLGHLWPTRLQMECAHSVLVGGAPQDRPLRAPKLAARSLPNPHTRQTRQTAHSPKLKISTQRMACVPRDFRPKLPFAPLDASFPSLAADLLISQKNVPTKTTMLSATKARRTTWLIGTTQYRVSLLIHPCLATTWRGQALASNTRRCRPLVEVR